MRRGRNCCEKLRRGCLHVLSCAVLGTAVDRLIHIGYIKPLPVFSLSLIDNCKGVRLPLSHDPPRGPIFS